MSPTRARALTRTAALGAALLLTLAACQTPNRTVAQGDGARVIIEPSPANTLTAAITIDADRMVRPTVRAVSADGHDVSVPPPRSAARHHEIILAGLRADGTYQIDVTGDPSLDRLSQDGALTFETGPLPTDLPPVETVVAEGATPGYTLFNASFGDSTVTHPGNLMIVDDEGEVVWYLQSDRGMADVRQLANGHLLFNHDSTGAREIDLLGNVVREWTTSARVEAGRLDDAGEPFYAVGAAVVTTSRLHHEVAHPRPGGGWLALGQEVRSLEGFDPTECPDGVWAGTTRSVRGDVVLEYGPDGAVRRRVPLLDLLDPRSVPGFAQCDPRSDRLLGDGERHADWTHGNAAEVYDDLNLLLISARNIDSLLAVRWEDDAEGAAGELLWRLGPGGDFDLTEGGEWFWAQHAPELLADGTLLVYDNGNNRPGSTEVGGSELPYSRAVRYAIEPPSAPGQRGTATQLWEHRLDGPRRSADEGVPEYASFLGDADHLGDDHVLITHGGIGERNTGSLRSRIIEVEMGSDALLLDLRIGGAPGTSWRTYRAEHLDTLYPAV